MRRFVEWLIDQIDAQGAARMVLDYGPMEAGEVRALSERGHEVTAVNVRGVRPLDERVAVTVNPDYRPTPVYEAVTCVHLASAFRAQGRQIPAFFEWTAPGGTVWLAVPVGRPDTAEARTFGPMRVFTREEALTLGQGELIGEAIFRGKEQITWWEAQDWAGIAGGRVRQVGVYGFRKASAKDTGAIPATLEDEQALPPFWTVEFISGNAEAPVQMGRRFYNARWAAGATV